MPGTTSTAVPSFSHDQHHETDAAKRKGAGRMMEVVNGEQLELQRVQSSSHIITTIKPTHSFLLTRSISVA